jgi:ketosteroid isomerase-like protein
MRKSLAHVWVVIPPLLLSALVHSTDPDVGGIRGLASPSVFVSVFVCGTPLVVMALLCFWLAVRFRWIVWASLSVLFSAAVALAIVLLQSPRQPGQAGIVHPFFGGTLLVWVFLAAAVLPARALARRWRQPPFTRSTHNGGVMNPTKNSTVEDVSATIIGLERAALARWGKGDPSGFLEICAPDIVYFDPSLERRIDGLEALARHYEPIRGKVSFDRFELLNPVVQVVGDAAVLTFNYVSYGPGEGQSPWNCTEVYRRSDGKWLIMQTHWSYTKSERA